MGVLIRFLVFLAVIWPMAADAEIVVAPQVVKNWPRQATTVFHTRMAIVDLGTLDEGEAVRAVVEVNNAVYKDLTAYIVDATNMALARQNMRFRYIAGAVKAVAPFELTTRIGAFGPYYLLLDNRYAAVIDKQVVYQVSLLKRLTSEQKEAIRAPLIKIYAGLKQMFEFKDFNILVRSCGEANAYSTIKTGDVTLCTELYDELADRPGAMQGILLHELGHTLLNLWGSPHYGDEDVADQFATNIMLRGGERGRESLSEWMRWFAEHDSRGQARHMLVRGDTHSLSVQRIRNIQTHMRDATDLMQRWNNILYPNMTDAALRSIVANPSRYDSVDIAKRELARRERLK